jgi:hypothetical protein
VGGDTQEAAADEVGKTETLFAIHEILKPETESEMIRRILPIRVDQDVDVR